MLVFKQTKKPQQTCSAVTQSVTSLDGNGSKVSLKKIASSEMRQQINMSMIQL